jgi:hypothetical protein
MYFEEER